MKITHSKEGSAILKRLYRRIFRKIRRYDDERGRRRPHLWYLGETAPETGWIDNALDADYRRNPKWQDPSIVSYYTGRDLMEEPDWEPGKRGSSSTATGPP